jgi:anti-anti-sigma factor
MPIENWSDNVLLVKLADDPHFAEELQTAAEVVARKPARVVVDLSAVKFINSSQIGKLLKLRQSMLSGGNRLILCGANSQVWGSFLVMGLDKVFEFTDAVPTALAAMQLPE